MATHVAVLPSGLPSGRFLRLPHPRTDLPTLFLPHQLEGSTRSSILEVQAVAPPNPRSWFIGQDVVADGKLLVMTPIDPAFLLIPVLRAVYPEGGSQGLFRPADEIFEDAATNMEQSFADAASKDASLGISKEDVLCFTSLDCCTVALKRICDFKEITEDLTVYRFSLEKVIQYLQGKVERLSTPETADVSRTIIRNLAKDGLLEDGKEELLKVGRIRAACDLIAQYVSPTMWKALAATYDFTSLDAYFKSIEEENAALAVEKPAKPKAAPASAAEKKRKTNTSQGVEKLKKVKTEGMAKLSTFFTKKAPG